MNRDAVRAALETLRAELTASMGTADRPVQNTMDAILTHINPAAEYRVKITTLRTLIAALDAPEAAPPPLVPGEQLPDMPALCPGSDQMPAGGSPSARGERCLSDCAVCGAWLGTDYWSGRMLPHAKPWSEPEPGET